ncbi:outer membrane beta-barrel protein [Sphingobacterium siyangense]|uniref:Outer membrane protein beta-barrel domain-containing protein n=1 Tax=Sphingobacterium siyangense TaxID=459529 RepID=A0A562MJ64_9SPHI|nr:outer membrane beta-barrel protein [Sphingobacterium siyangense]TWI19975.1 Outer membrane protein beta-barrel domain-containing protein [Sphingobacterium siyangense]
MKKLLLFSFIAVCCLISSSVSAQFSKPISIGAGAGGTFNLTDLGNVESKFAFYGELDYLITPFISVGLHGEKGTLAGNGYESDFKNRYFAGNINGKIRVGQFLDGAKNYSYYTLQANTLSRILSNVYVGAGAGLVKNRISRNISTLYANYLESSGGEIAKDPGEIHFVVPLEVGVDIPFGRTLYGPQWAINVNYQHTLTFNDNLDGIINKNNDQYGFVSVGVKYALFNRK